MPSSVLLTGATGYVGGSLLPELLRRGHRVRCLARDAAKATDRLPDDAEIVEGDVLDAPTLPPALEGIDVAYYLVHSMEGATGDGFAARDREGALAFGAAARRAGVRRVVYLGGLEGGDGAKSEHLASRDEVARILASHVDELVHVRAAMVIGSGSASFVMLRSLVEKLPVMVCPRWIDTRSQPVSVRDVVSTLAALAEPGLDAPREVQLGGADVLTYREMMRGYAEAAGRRAPLIVRTPVLSPQLSSYWVGLMTPVDAALARPLVLGLSAEMVVREPPPPGLNDAPLGFPDAVRAALHEG
ncbi:MAG: NAD(P)H-binding protein [Solirubrobacteraceae bacterium]